MRRLAQRLPRRGWQVGCHLVRSVRAACNCTAFLQQGLPEVGNRICDQCCPLVFWCEQDELGEALDDHRCQVAQVGISTLDALLDELIDFAVQTIGHYASLLVHAALVSFTARSTAPSGPRASQRRWIAPWQPETQDRRLPTRAA